MLTPTGMGTAGPLASNDTDEGKAQNRRVAVNVLVSNGVDGCEVCGSGAAKATPDYIFYAPRSGLISGDYPFSHLATGPKPPAA